jgi:hypothetical protein
VEGENRIENHFERAREKEGWMKRGDAVEG